MRGLSKRILALAAVSLMAASSAACNASSGSTGPAGSPVASQSPATATATVAPTPKTSPTPVVPPAAFTGAPSQNLVLWTFSAAGSIYGGATVKGGAAYFGSDDGNLYAVDTANHQLRWKFKTGGLIRSIPAVEGGLLYIASDDGNVYALNVTDGSQAWKVNIFNNAVARVLPDSSTSWDFHQSSPVVANGIVYVGSADSHLYALDARTGATKWTFKTPGMVRSTPLVADGTVYFGSWLTGLIWYSTTYALDAATGSQKWSFQGAGDHPTPTIVNGLLYTGGRQATYYALDIRTGLPVWTANFAGSWVESSTAYADGRVFVGSSGLGFVQALDAATGDVRWQFSTEGFPWSSPAVANGVVYVGSTSNDGATGVGLWAIDAKSGRGLWRVATGASLDTSTNKLTGVAAGPIVADGVIYVGALDGKLYAINAK